MLSASTLWCSSPNKNVHLVNFVSCLCAEAAPPECDLVLKDHVNCAAQVIEPKPRRSAVTLLKAFSSLTLCTACQNTVS